MPENTEQTVDSAAQAETVDSAQAHDEAASNDKAAGRSYSQAEMDSVIKKRIDKQSEKHADEVQRLNARIKELEDANKSAEETLTAIRKQKEAAEIVSKVASATGLPTEVVADLKGESEGELMQAAERLSARIPKYPEVRDGGGTKRSDTTKEQFVRNLFQSTN